MYKLGLFSPKHRMLGRPDRHKSHRYTTCLMYKAIFPLLHIGIHWISGHIFKMRGANFKDVQGWYFMQSGGCTDGWRKWRSMDHMQAEEIWLTWHCVWIGQWACSYAVQLFLSSFLGILFGYIECHTGMNINHKQR